MGGLLQVIFFLWIGWVVLVVIYHVVVGIFQLLKEVLGSFFDAPAPLSRPVTSQGHRSPTADSHQPPHKPASSLSLDAVSAPISRPYAPLRFLVECREWQDGQPYLLFKVCGGPRGAGPGTISYLITATTRLDGGTQVLGDINSVTGHPRAFRKSNALGVPLPYDDSWSILAIVGLDQMLPPRSGALSYHFLCEACVAGIPDSQGNPRAVGSCLEKAERDLPIFFPGPGYLDEIDWLTLREKLLSFLEGLIQGCEVDVPDKRSKFRSHVESLTPPVTSPARAAMLKVAIERAYISARPGSAIDYGIIDAVRMSKDAVLVEALARLAFQLACREPLSSEVRKVFAKIRATYDVNVNGYHVRDIDPLPPAVPVITPAPTPSTSPAVPSFELELEPIEEAGRVKAAEVHVRGFIGALRPVQPELSFWLWDETAGDVPFLVSSADIDQVHERAVHRHAWKQDEYDPRKWQSAGVIRFNHSMPPAGGLRRISVVGRTATKMSVGFFNSEKTARSASVLMNVAGSGYETIRRARHGLRYRAFVLAVRLALLSGKGPTYRQDKALKKFAVLLCAGIIDRKLAEGCQNELLTLLDTNMEDSHYGLTRQLDQLAAQAYPELKSKLLEAFVEVMASRKLRSKESRDFLEYSRSVLA